MRRGVAGDAPGCRGVEIGFPSACGEGATVLGTLWLPPGEAGPRALVQVVHGMAEHAGRYAPLAEHLAARGFAVVAHDQAAHGRSATSPRAWGRLPARGGADALVLDVARAREAAREALAGRGLDAEGLPCVLLGHSMGSLVARLSAARSDTRPDALVVCGTCEPPAAASLVGNLAARTVCALRGQDRVSPALDRMCTGGYAAKTPGATGKFDWLSHDRGNVLAYEQDPACGFMFSAGGYACLTELAARSSSRRCYRSTPSDLPVLVVSGQDDPVGDFGRAPARVAARYRSAGVGDVSLRLYPHMRHEILNEGEAARETVWHDLVEWLEGLE